MAIAFKGAVLGQREDVWLKIDSVEYQFNTKYIESLKSTRVLAEK